MGITKTIGGDRVGSGKKMQAHLHNYYRSTHNLSEKWASSMGSGILYPAMCKLAMRGDTFDIGINADARTIPTKGPLFGSYKMQIDVYQCPVRLYQALLHNNPLAIGLNMSQILFPQLEVYCHSRDPKDYKFSNSSLLKYLGISGMGTPNFASEQTTNDVSRRFNAIPALAYYDIFKTYYANKQEEKGYVITPQYKGLENALKLFNQGYANVTTKHTYQYLDNPDDTIEFSLHEGDTIHLMISAKAAGLNEEMTIAEINDYLLPKIKIEGYDNIQTLEEGNGVLWTCGASKWNYKNDPLNAGLQDGIYYDIGIGNLNMQEIETTLGTPDEGYALTSEVYIDTKINKIVLTEFDLANIDEMRYDILSHHTLGVPFVLKVDEVQHTAPKLPYQTLVSTTTTDFAKGIKVTKNNFPENGLVLKTYQNDIFNNWLNAEWIEGENGIAELSKVEVVDGAFTMDALNFAQKLYNMLNRIAIAGATYEDWQDVVYEEVKRKQIESPIYCGGMSQEVVFDEIVQTAPADGDPLGTLGGRGRLAGKKKGGKLHIKCDEACFIIAIVSLTPRIYYTQGNEFYMTDVKSMDDIHKPAMDGIGFQDLIGERMAWFDTQLQDTGATPTRSKIGKLPSWIEYMTSVDRAYGDFAETEGKGYMILNRNYEQDEVTKGIKDATTYIDPSKYNYAFAFTELEAQNFWVQINFDIKARRLMSARLIPNV